MVSVSAKKVKKKFHACVPLKREGIYVYTKEGTKSLAILPPFDSIEGQKWFDQISSQ
jgi:hypothetical protein